RKQNSGSWGHLHRLRGKVELAFRYGGKNHVRLTDEVFLRHAPHVVRRHGAEAREIFIEKIGLAVEGVVAVEAIRLSQRGGERHDEPGLRAGDGRLQLVFGWPFAGDAADL